MALTSTSLDTGASLDYVGDAMKEYGNGKSSSFNPNSLEPIDITPVVVPLSINDPAINFVQIYMHLLLIEDHTTRQGLMCKRCLHKHFFTCLALTLEAKSLDGNGFYNEVTKMILDAIGPIPMKWGSGDIDEKLKKEIRDTARQTRLQLYDLVLIPYLDKAIQGGGVKWSMYDLSV